MEMEAKKDIEKKKRKYIDLYICIVLSVEEFTLIHKQIAHAIFRFSFIFVFNGFNKVTTTSILNLHT